MRGEGKRRLYMLFAGQALVLLGLAVYLLYQPGKAGAGEDARLEALKAEVMNVHPGWDACWGQDSPETFCKLGVEAEEPAYVLWATEWRIRLSRRSINMARTGAKPVT